LDKFSLANISSQVTFTPLERITFFFFSTEISFTKKPALLQTSTGTTNSISSVMLLTSTAILIVIIKLLTIL